MPEINSGQFAGAQLPNPAGGSTMPMPFGNDQMQQMIMMWLMQQLNPNMQQQQQQQQQEPEPEMEPGWDKLMQFLKGQGEGGMQPHFSSIENILQRLNQPGPKNPYTNMFGIGNAGQSSSGAQMQRLANQPLSWGQRIGQGAGALLQDTSPYLGAAGAALGGPIGMAAAGIGSNLAGKGLSYLSQPYQMSNQGRR